jgi:hypothetical protein
MMRLGIAWSHKVSAKLVAAELNAATSSQIVVRKKTLRSTRIRDASVYCDMVWLKTGKRDWRIARSLSCTISGV